MPTLPYRRNWYEVYLLVLTLVWVVSASVYGQQVGIIAASFPAWSQHVWYGGLALGAALALAGVLWGTVTGLLVERAALCAVTGLCLAFGTAFLAALGTVDADLVNAVYAGPLVVAYGAVSGIRVRQITTSVREYRTMVRELGELRAGDTTP